MNVVLNPFFPGAGTPPVALVERQELLEKAHVAVQRVRALRSEKSLLLVGLSGVGKTVLLRTNSQPSLRCSQTMTAHTGGLPVWIGKE